MCARVKCLAVRYRFKKLNAAIHNFNSLKASGKKNCIKSSYRQTQLYSGIKSCKLAERCK